MNTARILLLRMTDLDMLSLLSNLAIKIYLLYKHNHNLTIKSTKALNT